MEKLSKKKLIAIILKQNKIIAKLKKEIAELRARLNQNRRKGQWAHLVVSRCFKPQIYADKRTPKARQRRL